MSKINNLNERLKDLEICDVIVIDPVLILNILSHVVVFVLFVKKG